MLRLVVALTLLLVVLCNPNEKRHFHNGVLPPYSGLPIKMMNFSEDQLKTLEKELPVRESRAIILLSFYNSYRLLRRKRLESLVEVLLCKMSKRQPQCA